MKDFVLQAIETLPPMPDTVIKFNEHYKQNGVYDKSGDERAFRKE